MNFNYNTYEEKINLHVDLIKITCIIESENNKIGLNMEKEKNTEKSHHGSNELMQSIYQMTRAYTEALLKQTNKK